MQALLQRLTSPPRQVLRTVQPTPFTVSYTVSTRPMPHTVPARLASHVSVLIRIIVGTCTALLLWILGGVYREKTEHILLHVLGRLRAEQLLELANRCQWMYVAPFALVVFILAFGEFEGMVLLRWYLTVPCSPDCSEVL